MAMHQSPLHPFNPFEIWSSAALAGAAAISAAIEATHAASKPWLLPVDSMPSSEAASPAVIPAEAQVDTQPLPLPSIFSFFAPAPASRQTAADRVEARSRPAPFPKSWYRAPYKSPFDPAFWMSPGHPADHLPAWMAMTGVAAMMPAATQIAPTGWPMPQPPTWPINPWNANPWLPNPTASNPSLNPWTASPWIDGLPRQNPWTAWLEASSAGWAAFAAPPAHKDNVVDFSAAYSAYRTAGGHASAQLVSSGEGSADLDRDRKAQPNAASAAEFPFNWPSLMWPWLKSH